LSNLSPAFRVNASAVVGTIPTHGGEIIMTGSTEVERGATRKRSFSLRAFCDRNGIGMTTAYAEIKAGRLVAHKIGSRTVIFEESEDAWRASLPQLEAGAF
jgi:hypothetical protein